MAMKGTKSFAEYAVRRWMAEQGLAVSSFTITITGRSAVVSDQNGDILNLRYDNSTGTVLVEGQGGTC